MPHCPGVVNDRNGRRVQLGDCVAGENHGDENGGTGGDAVRLTICAIARSTRTGATNTRKKLGLSCAASKIGSTE